MLSKYLQYHRQYGLYGFTHTLVLKPNLAQDIMVLDFEKSLMGIGDTHTFMVKLERGRRETYVILSSVMAFTRIVTGGAMLFSDCRAWMVPVSRQCLPCWEWIVSHEFCTQIISHMSHSQALPAFSYFKRWKGGRSLGTRLTYTHV